MNLQKAIREIKTNTGSLNIDLWNNQIKDEGAKAIAGGVKDTKLHSLNIDLWYNQIKDEGVKAIVGGIKDTKLNSLSVGLGYNPIEDEGTKAIAGGIKDTTLHSLNIDLRRNQIKDEGAKILSDAIKKSSAKIGLYYHNNDINEEGKTALKNALALNEDFKHREQQKARQEAEAKQKARQEAEEESFQNYLNRNAELNNKLHQQELAEKKTKQREIDKKEQSLEDVDVISIAQEIMESSESLYVDLSYNGITNQGAKILANAIKAVQVSIIINLNYNGITNQGFKSLTEASLDTIQEVKISLIGNEIDSSSDIISNKERPLSAYQCFNVFKEHDIKMCLNCSDRKIKVVLPAELEQCNSEDICVAPSEWMIHMPSCIDDKYLDDKYLDICVEKFAERFFIPCMDLSDKMLES